MARPPASFPSDSKRVILYTTLAGSLALVGAWSCSTPRPAGKPAAPPAPEFALSATRLDPKLLWTYQLDGLGTDLDLSGNGRRALLATVPDPETGRGHYGVSFLDDRGRLLWSKPSAPIKAESLARDGSWAVVSTYDNELIGLDGSGGRERWKAEGDCRPIIIAASRRILCWHDDDAEPGVAFDVFDWSGRKLASQTASRDLLALKPSADQVDFVAGFAGGGVKLFGPDFKPVWEKKLEGEIVDLAVSAGPRPRVAVLLRSRPAAVRKVESGGQAVSTGGKSASSARIARLAIFAADGTEEPALALDEGIEQVEISADGKSVAVYGNGHGGQRIGLVSSDGPKPGDGPKPAWEHVDPVNAEYTSQIAFLGPGIFAGYQQDDAASRFGHLLILDAEGKLEARISPNSDEGSYLYAFKYSEKSGLAMIATDDGKLSAYRLASSAVGSD